MAVYQKAYICPFRNGRPDMGKRFYVQFNPTELSIQEAIGAAEADEQEISEEVKRLLRGRKTGIQKPLRSSGEWKKKNQLTLSVSLFFNTLEKLNQDAYEDVRNYVGQLYPYTNKDTDSSIGVEQIYFFWGSIAVAGLLTGMSVRYTVFAPDGKPVRAQVDISIRGDYVGEQSFALIEGEAVGNEAQFGRNEVNTLLGEDPDGWRSRFGGTGNPRLE
ncbi:MAG: hypothetical protein NC123_10785 [Butyrivibrio sp.]|nr:hypothetical protein [Acetatifactor muris]MCM1560014.1 hypothetical protein [Butyrivibrio sp.]